MIFVKPGGDVTQLFDSYHPISVRNVLEKYYIGDLKLRPEDRDRVVVYEDELQPGGFYHVLKQRAAEYFARTGKNPRVHPHMYIKSVVILAGVIASYYGAFFATT